MDCKVYIKDLVQVSKSDDGVWKFLDDELKTADPKDFHDVTPKLLRSYLEHILKV